MIQWTNGDEQSARVRRIMKYLTAESSGWHMHSKIQSVTIRSVEAEFFLNGFIGKRLKNF
jgi:hypothetical protein